MDTSAGTGEYLTYSIASEVICTLTRAIGTSVEHMKSDKVSIHTDRVPSGVPPTAREACN